MERLCGLFNYFKLYNILYNQKKIQIQIIYYLKRRIQPINFNVTFETLLFNKIILKINLIVPFAIFI